MFLRCRYCCLRAAEAVLAGCVQQKTGNNSGVLSFEYNEGDQAINLIRALNDREARFVETKHEFQAYAQKWFDVFSKPNVERVTAMTYERQLRRHFRRVTKERPVISDWSCGADGRIRTGDLILTKDALYRLSYISALCMRRASRSTRDLLYNSA